MGVVAVGVFLGKTLLDRLCDSGGVRVLELNSFTLVLWGAGQRRGDAADVAGAQERGQVFRDLPAHHPKRTNRDAGHRVLRGRVAAGVRPLSSSSRCAASLESRLSVMCCCCWIEWHVTGLVAWYALVGRGIQFQFQFQKKESSG